VIAVVCVVQFTDLRPAYTGLRALTRGEAFHTWPDRPAASAWVAALPHYDHIVLYNPLQCGSAPVTFELPAYLAGLYGLTVNAGEVARSSASAQAAYCAALEARLSQGVVDDRELYLLFRPYESRLRAQAPYLRCGDIDNVRVCVTAASYEKWSGAARFE
jgi:hypothetical protein